MKKTLIWAALSISMLIFWIIGLMIGNAIFPSNLMESSGDPGGNGELILFFTCALNTAAVLYFIYSSNIKWWKLVGTLFLVIFGIQYFMSQIETLWFNDSLHMEISLILTIVTGGAIMALLFALSASWMTGKFGKTDSSIMALPQIRVSLIWKEVMLLTVILWPAVYFLAGYYIAWQFEAIRVYYSGSPVMESLMVMMKENVLSGLYFFQILRGLLWVLIALLVISTTKGSWLHRGLVLGLLLSFLGSSQLLLPNPIMPETVRIGHLIETSISSFIWGFILAWFLRKIIPEIHETIHIDKITDQHNTQVAHSI